MNSAPAAPPAEDVGEFKLAEMLEWVANSHSQVGPYYLPCMRNGKRITDEIAAALRSLASVRAENTDLLVKLRDDVAAIHDSREQIRAARDSLQTQVGQMREALTDINNCIAYSDTTGNWYLIGKERTYPALTKVRAALANRKDT